MITSLLRILSIHFWATGSTFLIETISLMLGIYLFWTSNTVNTRKKAWKKKKQAIFYISFQKGQLSHCVFSKNLSETKKTRTLFYFLGNKEGKFKSRSVSQALFWVFDFNKNHLCDTGVFYFTKYQRTKRKQNIQSDATRWILKFTGRLVSVVLHCGRCLTEHSAGWSLCVGFFLLVGFLWCGIPSTKHQSPLKPRYLPSISNKIRQFTGIWNVPRM